MRTFLISFAVLGLVACGQGSDSGTAGAPEDVAAGANPIVQQCLDLVAAGAFTDAVPVCTQAVEAGSADAEAALAQAQQELASAEAEASAELMKMGEGQE